MSSKQIGKSAFFSRLGGTLAFQLTAWYALSALVLVFLSSASLYVVLLTELERSTDLFLADKLHVLRTMLRDRPNDADALKEEIELESAARRYEHFYIRLLDAHHHPLLTTPGMAEKLDMQKLARLTQIHPEHAIRMTGKNGQAFRVAVAAAPSGSPPTQTDVIQIAIDVSNEEELLARYRFRFYGVMLGAFIVCPLAGYQIARRGIQPVEKMAATARRISSENLKERILTAGYPFELAELAGTFNSMLDRLEESFERISRFSADIAHDLRTPVNNIRGEAEVALARARSIDEYREVLESCLEGAVRLSDLIANLLFLARAESPLAHLHRERVDVAELLSGLQEYYEASASEGGILLTASADSQGVVAELDRTLVQRAVGNLISNAVAHTPPGGSVVLAAKADGAALRIEVTDTGCGIPPDALPRVCDRFFRVDPSRSQASGGTGLGLAIVQGIMLLHGGTVEIASEMGKGTQVRLVMPVFGQDDVAVPIRNALINRIG